MGRCYHLSKTVTEDLANEIIKELTERGDVKHASSKYLQPYCKLRAVLCEI